MEINRYTKKYNIKKTKTTLDKIDLHQVSILFHKYLNVLLYYEASYFSFQIRQ